jgi:hypothetical protein
MDDYETSLKVSWNRLNYLPVLTVKQIKLKNNNCVRMYLYCYYNYPEFYNYKKKKLLKYINKHKDNLILFSAWCGHLNIVKYLIASGLNINHTNNHGFNAYMCAANNHKYEMMIYLETTNINIYQRNHKLENACDIMCEMYGDRSRMIIHLEIYKHIINKTKYIGVSKICSICYECKNDIFITCKNNHIVHLICQADKDRNRCLMCSARYLI